MMKKSKILKVVSAGLLFSGFVLSSGNLTEVAAQKGGDPFARPSWARRSGGVVQVAPPSGTAKSSAAPSTGTVKKVPPPIVPTAAPDIAQRINFYKQMRLQAAENGQPLPKVTSVLTLDEMSITGIFRTPRGFAAMVEAKPIELSYTIYPGEKFFDGQLVAIEENRLVFRKVTKMSNGKIIASVENKSLRQYTDQEQIRGTAPIQPGEKPTQTAENVVPSGEKVLPAPPIVISPLDELEKQPAAAPPTKEAKPDKKGKKAVKVARNKS